MDKASILGSIIFILVFVGAVEMSESPATIYLNLSALLIVFGGTFGAVLVSHRLNVFFDALKNILLVFNSPPPNFFVTIDNLAELSDLARKKGYLVLEDKEIDDPFLYKAIHLLIDGQKLEATKYVLNREIIQTKHRNDQSIRVLNSITESAPAIGMIGTLFGLVAMLANMDDPNTIGPAMSVALLTTLYGALLANGFSGPFARKLGERADEIYQHMLLVRDGIAYIAKGENPTLIAHFLASYAEDSVASEHLNSFHKNSAQGEAVKRPDK